MIDDKIVGKGIIFPLRVVNGTIPIDSGIDLIRSSLKVILRWDNDRYFLGEFRSKLKELLEDPNDLILIGLVQHFIVKQITKWETRITLLEAPKILQENNKLSIQLTYRINKTAEKDSFVFPFYTKPLY